MVWPNLKHWCHTNDVVWRGVAWFHAMRCASDSDVLDPGRDVDVDGDGDAEIACRLFCGLLVMRNVEC